MSNAVSALNGASFDGFVKVRDEGLRGMITLRADFKSKKLAAALKTICGVKLPAQRKILRNEDIAVAWMSPDELMIFCDYDAAPALAEQISAAMENVHHLAEVVSDARAIFSLTGEKWREVIAKLAPVDLSPEAFALGDMRRTRFAQVAAGFWSEDEGTAHVMCFRSVAQYMFDILSLSATEGSEVDYFDVKA